MKRRSRDYRDRDRDHVQGDAVPRAAKGAGPAAGLRVAEPEAHPSVRRVHSVLRGDQQPGLAGVRSPRDGVGRRSLRTKGPDAAQLQGAGIRVRGQSSVHR